ESAVASSHHHHLFVVPQKPTAVVEPLVEHGCEHRALAEVADPCRAASADQKQAVEVVESRLVWLKQGETPLFVTRRSRRRERISSTTEQHRHRIRKADLNKGSWYTTTPVDPGPR